MRPLARHLLRPDQCERIQRLPLADEGYGFDRFGMSHEGIAFMVGMLRPLYERYFRVTSYGAEHIPETGAAMIACNHSGTIPLDAMMLACDVLWNTHPPRSLRVLVDHFVDGLPGVNVVYARAGAVGGSRGNVHALMSAGELLGVFPEGVPGIGKPFSERYQLQAWRPGHAELAIQHGVPVVPACVIGAEEQWPQVARIRWIKPFGSPYLPVVATPLPMPVHYRIHYGEPIPRGELYRPEDARRRDAVEEAAGLVRDAVQALIHKGLEQRTGVFS
jgi:1-acyl-sn-glycerol-3-phosphate acyltransferase